MPITTVTDSEGNTIVLKEYKGRMYPNFPDLESNLDALQTFQARDEDVFLVAYPSSGTHWVWEMTNMLFSGKAETHKGTKLELFIEMAKQEHMDAIPSTRVLNTHLRPDMLSPNLLSGKCKILFVLRNPKDQMVSMYNHTYNFKGGYNYNGTFNGYCHLAMQGQIDYGGWFAFYLHWEEYLRNNPHIPVLTLYYEDMKEDTAVHVRRLAEFLDVPCSDILCQEIVDKCTFKNMKSEKDESYPDTRRKQWRDGKYQIFRKGIVGDWKNYFTVQQNELFDAEFKKQMQFSSLKFRFTI